MGTISCLRTSLLSLVIAGSLLSGCNYNRPHHPKGEPARVEGTVQSVNYTRGGNIDGFILKDGTFVHFGPRQSEDIKYAVGSKITVAGDLYRNRDGVAVIEAREINGQPIIRR